MKRCPECRKDYFDDTLLYCLDDGAALVQGTVSDEPATAILSGDAISGERATRTLNASETTAQKTQITDRLSALFSRERLPWILVAVFAVAVLVASGFAIKYGRQTSATPFTSRFAVGMPDRVTALLSPVLSPDGKNLAFSGLYEGNGRLWIRSLGSLVAQPIPGSERLQGVHAWSPDSRSLVFPAAGKLMRYDLGGGNPQPLCDLPKDMRISDGPTAWNQDGVILFSGRGKIYRVAATGGNPEVLLGAEADPNVLYGWPYFLPDGKHFLYPRRTSQSPSAEIYVAALDGNEGTRLLTTDSQAIYTPSGTGGYLLFAKGGALYAQPFDAGAMKLVGEQFVVADRVTMDSTNRARFSVSDNGSLVFDGTGGIEEQQLVWIDREGKETEPIGQPGMFEAPRLSPDATRIAVARRDPETQAHDIYVIDLARGTNYRLTSDPANDTYPIWSPDGSHIAWSSNRNGAFQIYQKATSGIGDDELLYTSSVIVSPQAWSSDGRFLLCDKFTSNNMDLWIVPADSSSQAFAYLETPFAESKGRFSPDGRWIAYQQNDQSTRQVYVQPFPAAGSRLQISSAGGTYPVWSKDGKELFYISPDNKMMAVDLKPGADLQPGLPKQLFDMTSVKFSFNSSYSVSPDGKRFLFVANRDNQASLQFTVVLNWAAEAKK